ncbi:Protein prenyltransferase alpha subunit repeat-containing protein 1 [Dinochytrium kinnereticum]|nr:Protein prenyltransferase alpha subunit repeat-containing protein 1 [Dinochytrium kinnereticum]
MELFKFLTETLRSQPLSSFKEYGIIPPGPGEFASSASDNPFQIIEGNLAIPLTALRPVYTYANHTMLKLHAELSDASNTDHHPPNALLDYCNSSQIVALLNPENYTAWNARRRIQLMNLASLEEEFALLNLIMSLHPKRAALWTYRYWLFETMQKAGKDSADIYEMEFTACSKASSRYRMNYNCWSYRLRLAKMAPMQVLYDDWKQSRAFVRSNISDDTAFCYRLALVHLLLEGQKSTSMKYLLREDIASEAIETLKTIIELGGNESLWRYLGGLRAHVGKSGISEVEDFSSIDDSLAKLLEDFRSEKPLEKNEYRLKILELPFWLSLGVEGWLAAKARGRETCIRHALNYIVLIARETMQPLWQKEALEKLEQFQDIHKIPQESIEYLYWTHPDSLEKVICARLLLNQWRTEPTTVTALMWSMKRKGLDFYDALEILCMMSFGNLGQPSERDADMASETVNLLCGLIGTPFERTLWSLHPCLLALISCADQKFRGLYLPRLSSWTLAALRLLSKRYWGQVEWDSTTTEEAAYFLEDDSIDSLRLRWHFVLTIDDDEMRKEVEEERGKIIDPLRKSSPDLEGDFWTLVMNFFMIHSMA